MNITVSVMSQSLRVHLNEEMLAYHAMSDSCEFSQLPPATMKKTLPASLTLATSLFLVSCSGFQAADIVKKPLKSVAKLIPQRIPIAEVRTKDLKEMPTGAERAMAFEQKRNRRIFAFIPGLYKAPTLPDAQTVPADGGILPPLRRDKRSTD